VKYSCTHPAATAKQTISWAQTHIDQKLCNSAVPASRTIAQHSGTWRGRQSGHARTRTRTKTRTRRRTRPGSCSGRPTPEVEYSVAGQPCYTARHCTRSCPEGRECVCTPRRRRYSLKLHLPRFIVVDLLRTTLYQSTALQLRSADKSDVVCSAIWVRSAQLFFIDTNCVERPFVWTEWQWHQNRRCFKSGLKSRLYNRVYS